MTDIRSLALHFETVLVTKDKSLVANSGIVSVS